MKNQRKFNIDLKKYRKYCQGNGIAIPDWFKGLHFDQVIKHLEKNEKLQACKFLCETSSRFNTREIFDLKWSKTLVVDIISEYEDKSTQHVATPISNVSFDEVSSTLEPFAELASQCLYNSNFSFDQTIYAFNHAKITMQDLRNVVSLLRKIKEEQINSK